MKADKLLVALIALVMVFACSKEEVKLRYSRQEQNIESFVNSTLKSVDTAYVVYNKGVTRLVVVPAEAPSLSVNGTVSFHYAGYVLSGTSVNASDMFATNSEEVAKGSGWTLSDDSVFEPKTVKLSESGFVKGLKYGLEGVKAGQECYILFSGKYGFGKRELGTIPANSALVYRIWVESITND